MKNNNISKITLADLPIIPEIISVLLIELNKEEPDSKIISQLITKDAFITTKLISLANSSYFNLFRKIDNVDDVLKYIGFKKITNIILLIGLSKTIKNIKGLDMYTLWRFNLNTSKICEHIASLYKHNMTTALTVGLLHGIGEFILYLKMNKELIELDNHFNFLDLNRVEVESDKLKINYLEVTTCFLEKNNFSKVILNPLKEQMIIYNNSLEYKDISDMGLILHLAIWISKIKTKDQKTNLYELDYPKKIISHLGLEECDVLVHDDSFWVTKDEVMMLVN